MRNRLILPDLKIVREDPVVVMKRVKEKLGMVTQEEPIIEEVTKLQSESSQILQSTEALRSELLKQSKEFKNLMEEMEYRFDRLEKKLAQLSRNIDDRFAG